MERLRRWIAGVTRGGVPVAGLDGLRAVGGAAYALQNEADELRAGDAWDPWAQPTQTQLFLLSAWNAFALQTLADHVLDTGDRVEAAALAFAQACLRSVPLWIESARSAKVDPAFRPAAALPAHLPAWPRVGPSRDAVRILRAAHDSLAPLPEYEMARMAKTAPPVRHAVVVAMEVDVSQMHTAREFAADLEAHAQSGAQFLEARDQLLTALGLAFTLGQAVALPSLLERIALEEYRRIPSAQPPLTAVSGGWSVEDATGTPIGTVERIDGEPKLGIVNGLIVDAGAFSADRRATVDQVASIGMGVVRLNVAASQLEPA